MGTCRRICEDPLRELRDAVRAHHRVLQPDEVRPALVRDLDVPVIALPRQADAPPVHVGRHTRFPRRLYKYISKLVTEQPLAKTRAPLQTQSAC